MSIVEVNGLHKSYGGTPAVNGVTFAVEEGEIFGILGPNGAGKTTTVECVEGLRVPDAGTVRVAGYDPVTQRPEVARVLGVQLQHSELQPKLTVREALELYSAFYPSPTPWRPLAERLGLGPLLHRRFAGLSGGQRQRLFLALSLVGGVRVAVFDELTTGLDPQARRDTWELIEEIRASGVTVLLVTHVMAEAQRLCDRVAVIDRGRVAALDTPQGLIARSGSPTVVSFRPSRPLPDGALRELPDVSSVTEHGGRVVLHGTDTTVNALITLLARNRVTAAELRVTDATLDDAYLSLVERHASDTTADPRTAPTTPTTPRGDG